MNDIKDWSLRGRPQGYGHTNASQICYATDTNIVVGGNSVTIVMVLKSGSFEGALLGAESGQIYWSNGKTVEPIVYRGQNKK
jgi:hypothetical protein